MTLSAANILQILFAFQATFFGMLAARQTRLRSLALLLMAFALHMTLNLLAETDNLGSFPNITSAFGFIYGPLIYLFVRDICRTDPALTGVDALHGIPFLIALPFSPSSLIFDILGFASISTYFIATYRYIRRYEFSVCENIPQNSEAQLNWIKKTFYALVLLTLYDAARIFLSYRFDLFDREVFYLITLGGAFLTVNWLIVKAFIFRAAFSGLAEAEFLPDTSPSMSHTPLSQADIQDVEAAIRLLQEQQLYLNPHLRLATFADAAGQEPRHLSSLIYSHLGIRFPMLVNGFRVDYAKDLIDKAGTGACNFLAISYQAGFNSKSSFNLVFKQIVGMTPTAYRQSRQKAQLSDQRPA